MFHTNELKVGEFVSFAVKYMSAVLSRQKATNVEPFMLWGPPGIGKSKAMKQIGEEVANKVNKEFRFTDIRLLNFNPVDLRGIPVPDMKEKLAVWLKPQIFQMDESDRIVNFLILDEISACAPSVQASAYQITLDRQIGEHRIPDNCVVICAGNRTTDKSVAYNMPLALADRLAHFYLKSDFDDWKTWAIRNDVDPRIVSYLHHNPDKLNNFNPAESTHTFCTPRSWEKISRELSFMAPDEALPLIAGHIGKAIATDFNTHTKIFHKLPDINLIIQGKCKDYPNRPDTNIALISCLVNQVNKIDNKGLDNILSYGLGLASEYKAVLFKDVAKLGEDVRNRMLELPHYEKFVDENPHLITGKVD
jgi:DNA polymerase III delta prime subunit